MNADFESIIKSAAKSMAQDVRPLKPEVVRMIADLMEQVAGDLASEHYVRVLDIARAYLRGLGGEEVYEHFVVKRDYEWGADESAGRLMARAACGKKWDPNANLSSPVVGRCPDCENRVSKGWLA